MKNINNVRPIRSQVNKKATKMVAFLYVKKMIYNMIVKLNSFIRKMLFNFFDKHIHDSRNNNN